ncbi:tubulin folding cofactor D C terminal-domain-containing protein [Xylariaceae sp. FL0016]|nr:tubulin folding cofactor D C terminal-domain-containing protein [Xylariaceae sp. FL0016]
MDASEQDQDVLIQRFSADLIADFDHSLEPFLRKPNGQLRRRVRLRETFRLTSQVLEPFQELPQLLDPLLPKWLPVLSSAYLECLQDRRKSRDLSMRSQLLTPLSNAICMILYTFCKIRGEKVIVRFLNVETRYLELLLLAIEDAEREVEISGKQDRVFSWSWHERYIVLLWSSQLFFAPFDLSTISSGDADDFELPKVDGFEWPSRVPGITLRVIPLATKYLASPGKERDGAKALLVRLAMRRDMQEVGVLRALVRWSLATLKPKKDAAVESPYYYIGSLSFLAGVLGASADTSTMDEYLPAIFYATQAISSEENDTFNVINGSALARKMMIKVTRSVITLVLRKSQQSMADTEMVETTIGYLLERLADNDTPVRLAASKALSIITLKLDPDMASQVIEAVLDSLNRNVLTVKNKLVPGGPPTRDLTAVDPLEWHGLMLTLSHLLYRRSPPLENLSDIVHALLMGLSFEKRSPSGSSIGTNVRDASCFGIWGLARRYSTKELLQVQPKLVMEARGHESAASILQVIATELVVAASLDPAGNIRRGASAALQELIGRHPDTVDKGIAVVQTVDYHAVALRARAINEVGLQATKLSTHYGQALLEATLGWRGIGEMDVGARRVAAAANGDLTAELAAAGTSSPLAFIQARLELLLTRLKGLQVRQVEEHHGLLLSLAAVLDLIPSFLKDEPMDKRHQLVPITEICGALGHILQDVRVVKYRKPELIAEAVSKLVVSSTPILLLNIMPQEEHFSPMKNLVRCGAAVVNADEPTFTTATADLVDILQSDRPESLDLLLVSLEANISVWLDRNEPDVTKSASDAALVLLIFSEPSNRERIVQGWCDKVRHSHAARNKHGDGYFHALVRAYTLTSSLNSAQISRGDGFSVSKVLAERWTKDVWIETRVAILQSLVNGTLLKDNLAELTNMLSEGLDDYTTTARGDIGSHVRLEAIKAARAIWEAQAYDETTMATLFPRILRLAAEKLDRVRVQAQAALVILLQPGHHDAFKTSWSSRQYFEFLFQLCTPERLNANVVEYWAISQEECIFNLLAGLATSADTGNEDLVIASRAALANFCEDSEEKLRLVCAGLLHNLKQYTGQDRVVVPTLEVIAYLYHVGLLQRCHGHLNTRQLCVLVQKAAYKTGNVRKLEACIKIYSAVAADVSAAAAGVTGPPELGQKRQEAVVEARRRLAALMTHPWPKVRSMVVDELWVLLGNWDGDGEGGDGSSAGRDEKEDDDDALPAARGSREALLGVDWGKADKSHVKRAAGVLGLE